MRWAAFPLFHHQFKFGSFVLLLIMLINNRKNRQGICSLSHIRQRLSIKCTLSVLLSFPMNRRYAR